MLSKWSLAMFDIYYKGIVVASANTFANAKAEANIYRRQNFITDWRSVTFKKRRQTHFASYFKEEDDGCCDEMRDLQRELYGLF